MQLIFHSLSYLANGMDAVAITPQMWSGKNSQKIEGFLFTRNVIGQSIRRYFNSKKSKS